MHDRREVGLGLDSNRIDRTVRLGRRLGIGRPARLRLRDGARFPRGGAAGARGGEHEDRQRGRTSGDSSGRVHGLRVATLRVLRNSAARNGRRADPAGRRGAAVCCVTCQLTHYEAALMGLFVQTRAKPRLRPVGAVEIASSVAALLAPRGLHPDIDCLRHDVRAVVDGLSGKREPAFTDRSTPRVIPVPLRAIDPIEHLLPRGRLRRGWSSLRTDVRWLLRDLRGDRRPATIARAPSRYRSRAVVRDVMASARPLRVTRVARETQDAITITLTEASGAPITFQAGQFLTFNLQTESGEWLTRAYSLSACPLDGEAAITVKRIAGGRGSALMHALREGDVLLGRGPSGAFLPPSSRREDVVMIAGGSGIAPVVSIAETVLRSRPAQRVSLIYGSRAQRDIIFAERLERLRARFPDRLRVDHVLHDPEEDWKGARGLLDRATIHARLDAAGVRGECAYYVCGPAPMMDAARDALLARGVLPERIREERFRSPAGVSMVPLPDAPVALRAKLGGRERVARVAPGQTLLEAGLAAGIDLPFSCAMGGCGACKVKLVAGTIHTDDSSCLSSRERADGFVLTCCSRPTSEVVLEVIR